MSILCAKSKILFAVRGQGKVNKSFDFEFFTGQKKIDKIIREVSALGQPFESLQFHPKEKNNKKHIYALFH